MTIIIDITRSRLESRSLRSVSARDGRDRNALFSVLTQRAHRLDLESAIDEPPDEWSGGRRTDRCVLQQAAYATLTLSPGDFRRHLEELVDSLDERRSLFAVGQFSDERLFGWCFVLANACGLLNLANRRFLYRLGETLAPDLSGRLETLTVAGIGELNDRYGRAVQGPDDWRRMLADPDTQARRHLANAASHLARDAYAFVGPRPLSDLVAVFRTANFDLLVQTAGIAPIPFSHRDDELWTACTVAVEDLASWLGRVDAAGVSDVCNRAQPDLVVLRKFCADASAHLGLAHSAPPARQRDDAGARDAIGAVDVDTLRLNLLRRCKTLRDAGMLAQARQLLPPFRRAVGSRLDALHSYLLLSGELLSQQELYEVLIRVRELLRSECTSRIHDANFVARAIQYSDLAEDHHVLENALTAMRSVRSTPPREVRPGDTVLLIALEQCRVTPALLAALVPTLESSGVHLRNLQANRVDRDLIPTWEYSPLLTAESHAIVGSGLDPDQLALHWVVDVDAGRIEHDGVNYYQGIYERVARILKVYTVDWSMPQANAYLAQMLTKTDRTVAALEGVRVAAEERDLKVRFASLQSQFAPFAAIRAYCDAHPQRLEHVTLGASYENWRTNVDGSPLSTLCLLNNTRHPSPSRPAFGLAHEFEKWYTEVYRPRREEYRARACRLTRIERAGPATATTAGLVARMQRDRSRGHMVFCLLGKIPYDLAVPYQGGPAHSSMKDWLNHTVDVLADVNHRLYVKPHPHEFNPSISAHSIEGFADLIRDPRSPGVTVLPHRGISVQHLLGVVDVFLCWNGSSIAELGSQGAKVLAADDWARRNYPLHVLLPDDRGHYATMLRGESPIEMHPEFKDRCVAYTGFLTEAPFALPIPFVNRSSTNTLFNRATIDFAALPLSDAPLAGHTERIRQAFGVIGETLRGD